LAALLGKAFPEMVWSAGRVRTDLLDASDVDAIFVAEREGAIVATASARSHAGFPGLGYVHWVAVDPARRGEGLFEDVMGVVMARFVADGRPAAILETDDVRLPAITAYLRLGYVPHYRDPDHEERWSRIFTQLGQARRMKDRQK
jgi:mycothiol synthase